MEMAGRSQMVGMGWKEKGERDWEEERTRHTEWKCSKSSKVQMEGVRLFPDIKK